MGARGPGTAGTHDRSRSDGQVRGGHQWDPHAGRHVHRDREGDRQRGQLVHARGADHRRCARLDSTIRLAALKTGRFYTLPVRTLGGLPWVRNGLNTFKWNVEPGGKLPLGLRLNTQTGKLIGTPRKEGTYRFTLRVADKFGTSDTQRLVLVVRK